MSEVRDTSLLAFIELKENPKHLGEMQMKVYEFIRNNPYCCDREISEGLGIAINSITNRRGEILAKEFIIDCGTKKYNGRSVHFWKSKE